MPRLHVDVPDAEYHRNLISCQVACPVHTDARGYVRAIAAGRFEDAYLIARGPNPLASICGRVCGAPCEAACRRGKVPRVDDDGRFVAQDRPIAIRALKRFACEQYGPESRPTAKVLQAVRRYVPEVSADAEEMAALLRANLSLPCYCRWGSRPTWLFSQTAARISNKSVRAGPRPMRVRAISDEQELAARLTWADASRDDLPSASRFCDACAIQLPAKMEPTGPAPQMGEVGRPVEIT